MSNYSTVELQYGMEKDSGTTKLHALGRRGALPDGRVFRYALANGAIGAGQLCQSHPAISTLDMDLVCEAASVGSQTISVVTPGTHVVIAATLFEDGYVYINDGAGEGHTYKVASNTTVAADSATILTLTLDGDDAVSEALATATSLAGLIQNPYKDIVPVDKDTTFQVVVGVAPAEIDDNEYFWAQTWGTATVLIEGGTTIPALGRAVVAAITTSDGAGSVEGVTTDGSSDAITLADRDMPIIGIAGSVAAVDSDYGQITLTIAQ